MHENKFYLKIKSFCYLDTHTLLSALRLVQKTYPLRSGPNCCKTNNVDYAPIDDPRQPMQLIVFCVLIGSHVHAEAKIHETGLQPWLI